MLRASRRLFNSATVHKIKSPQQYEDLKLTSRVLVGYFHNGSSTASKLYSSRFEDMSKSGGPNCTFFSVDVDEVPTVAYDSEVVDLPAVSVLPLGSKSDGTMFDKTDLGTFHVNENLEYEKIFGEAKSYIDAADVGGKDSTEGARKPWEFDPATGTTLPPTM